MSRMSDEQELNRDLLYSAITSCILVLLLVPLLISFNLNVWIAAAVGTLLIVAMLYGLARIRQLSKQSTWSQGPGAMSLHNARQAWIMLVPSIPLTLGSLIIRGVVPLPSIFAGVIFVLYLGTLAWSTHERRRRRTKYQLTAGRKAAAG